ncbi:PIF1-like helicase domain-containing protein [Apiospora marii]|uniref:PIF1-like helicase domain-containing protein n=1 Tax=Apiospora marii TaxID=335849 RepID=UPI003130A83E
MQKKEDADAVTGIQGASVDGMPQIQDSGYGSASGSQRMDLPSVVSGPQIRLEVGPYTTYTDVALALMGGWTLNNEQSLAVLLPAAFLDARGPRLQEEEGPQHLQYVGGEGGTGKSRVFHALRDMFRLKRIQHTLLLTGASGNAAALIGGVTIHSAANIGFGNDSGPPRRISEEEKLRWKSKVMLVIDEVNQVGGLTLAAVDSRLRQYRDDGQRPFDGIPIVVFFGDFYQEDKDFSYVYVPVLYALPNYIRK